MSIIMGTPAVGEDIEALCGKCGQVWHVVMAKMGDKIAKVVCKRCGGHHLYRTEQGSEAATSTGSQATRGAAARRARTRVPTPVSSPVPPFDPSKPPRPYSAAESFAPGERVQHPTFGGGVVTGSPGPGKVEIAFPIGRRVLASAKIASTLERPSFVTHVPVADRPPDKM
ncbi:MAG: hypothetical protein ABUR63_03375 [Verrucomicrobiota bacterium]